MEEKFRKLSIREEDFDSADSNIKEEATENETMSDEWKCMYPNCDYKPQNVRDSREKIDLLKLHADLVHLARGNNDSSGLAEKYKRPELGDDVSEEDLIA